jgi:hypothetical protein
MTAYAVIDERPFRVIARRSQVLQSNGCYRMPGGIWSRIDLTVFVGSSTDYHG